jgi:hypothetical protein
MQPRCEDCPELQFRDHLISYFYQLVLSELRVEISIISLEKQFNDPRAAFKKALVNRLEPSKPRGRHTALPYDIEAYILAKIQRHADKFQPSTRADTSIIDRNENR